MKPDVACEAGSCLGLPRKASLSVCLHCQQDQGRCQEGLDRMAGCGPLALGLPWRVWKETAPSGQQRPLPPHGAHWELSRLTYWKGRRMARISPLKKRVMSSTKSTPWQEVKSNYKDGTDVSYQAEAFTAGTFSAHPWNSVFFSPPIPRVAFPHSAHPLYLSPARALSLDPLTPSPCP